MANLVEIIISGKNLAGPAIAQAESQAKGLVSGISAMGVAAGAAAALVAAKAVSMASQFQSAMEMIHTQAGIPQAAIAGLSQQVLGLAGTVGFAPLSLADALFHVESSFASMPGVLNQAGGALGVLKIAAEGAAVGHSDLTDTTNALDAAIASGIPGVQNINAAMGALNATVGAGDMKMQDLAQALGTGLLAVVKGYGVTMADVGAGLAVFGDNNIRGATAATDLRMAIQAMSVPAKSGAAELAHMGMSMSQMGQDMAKGGLLPALEDFKTHMEKAGIAADQQGQVITEVFGKKAGAGIAVLLGQMDRLQSKYPDIAAASGNFTGAVAANNDTMAQKTKDARAAFDALMVELGNVLLPVVTKVADAFRVAATFLVQHKAAAEALAIVLGTLVVAALAAVAVAAYTAMAPFLPWVALVAAVGVAAYELISNWSSVASFFSDMWNAVVGAFSDALNAISGFFSDIGSFFADLPGKAGDALSSLAGVLGNAASDAWNAFTTALGVAFQATLQFLIHLPHEIGFALGFLAGLLARLAVDGWKAFTHGLETAWVATVAWFLALPGNIVSFFSDVGHWLTTSGVDLIKGIGQGIVNGFVAVVNWFTVTLPNSIHGFFSDVGHWLTSSGVGLLRGLATGIANGAVAVWNWFGALPGNVLHALGDIGSWLVNAGSMLIHGLWNGIKAAGSWLWNQITSFASGVVSGFLSAFGVHSPATTMLPVGEGLVLGIAKGINDNMHHAINAAVGMKNSVVGAMSGSAALGLSMTGSTSVSSSVAAAQAGAGGGGMGLQVTFDGNLDGAMSTAVMRMIREGKILIRQSQIQTG